MWGLQMTSLLRAFQRTAIYKFVVLSIIPNIRFSTKPTKIRGNQYKEAYKRLQVGDIILTRDESKLAGKFIDGYWDHVALFLGKEKDFEVAEMTRHGFTKSEFADVFKESSRFKIVRSSKLPSDYIEKMINKCISFDGKHYDTGFSLGIEELYCSEMIFQCDIEMRLKFDLSDLKLIGQPYLSPDGVEACHNLDIIVFDSDSIAPRY